MSKKAENRSRYPASGHPLAIGAKSRNLSYNLFDKFVYMRRLELQQRDNRGHLLAEKRHARGEPPLHVRDLPQYAAVTLKSTFLKREHNGKTCNRPAAVK